MTNVLRNLNELSETKKIVLLGLIFFLYSLSVSAAIQLYIVPEIVPNFDRGDGLISLDSPHFNGMAKDMAKEIREKGWGAWEFRPATYAHVGIAAIFYTLWVSKPYSVLPYNALLHAMSGCLVLWLLLNFFSWGPAMLGSALFVINPSAMEWVAQIHRDGIFILGNIMVLTCLVQLFRGLQSANVRTLCYGFICGTIGSCFVWFGRTYWVQVLLFSVLLGIVFMSVFYWLKRKSDSGIKMYEFLFMTFAVGLVLFQVGLIKQNVSTNVPVVVELPASKETVRSFREAGKKGAVGQGEEELEFLWEQNQWIPERVQLKLFQISYVRNLAVTAAGNTIVDEKVVLNSVADFVRYLPRALVVGILSPMPNLWVGEGSSPAMTMARKVMGATTLVFYCLLLGGLGWIFTARRDPMMWIIIGFSLIGILVFTIAYPNVGTLLRFRYGFYMLLIAFGGANLLKLMLEHLGKNSTA